MNPNYPPDMQNPDDAGTTTCVHAVVGRCDDTEKVMEDRIYLSLWENQGYLPDPVQHAFREAMVQTAMQICHECGTEEATVKFCADTIVEWMKHDPPNCAGSAMNGGGK